MMAGEIEEPFSVQMASLHSSSISFGRFEPESLSWERRSSFSHNRYLEEVEKYSTPGSVTEKKAYFEAHFKKKALLRQSLEFQNEMTDQTTSNDMLDDMSYIDEFVNSNDEYGCPPSDDQTKNSSDYHGECEVLSYHRESEEIISPDFHAEASFIDEVGEADGGSLCSEHIGAQQSLLVHDRVVLNKDKSGLDSTDNVTDEADNVASVESADPSPKFQDVQKEHTLSTKKAKEPSSKGPEKGQLKAPKPKVRSQATGLVQRKFSSEITKDSAKNSKKGEREGVRKPKPEKQIRPKVPFNATSLSGAVKSEDPKKLKLKSSQENKSEKDERTKRVSTTSSAPQRPAADKIVPRTCQSTNRAMRNAVSNKSEAKMSGAVFSFKSDERAEKRKEFFTKLGEKMHAKEAEMNQIQSKTQVASAHAKPNNARNKSTSPGSRPIRSSVFRKPGSQLESSATEFANTTRHSQEKSTNFPSAVPSERSGCAPSASTSRSPSPSASRRIETIGKKERDNGRTGDAQKHRGSVVTDSSKGERGEMIRKMKGLGIGGSSGMDRLPVGVAS
ncbi:hypothetical protein Scep_022991 [Stephania cephalantha]|uniref:TPX2 C-terminal domain-containing protein n=1 Tax=Stephania cephalantha TaxID=152367 RepID=A0AAP0F939_9MAGN